jgi:hypothetical protein
MQDPPYRMRTTMNAMGYMQVPILSYVPEALSPNLNLTIMGDRKGDTCRVVAVAPMDKPLNGTLALTAPKGVTLAKTEFTITITLPPADAPYCPYSSKASLKNAATKSAPPSPSPTAPPSTVPSRWGCKE